MIVWQIWKERNDRVWNGVVHTPTHVVFTSATVLREWNAGRFAYMVDDQLEARSHVAVTGARGRCQAWHTPGVGYLKINVDATFFVDSNQTGLGMVIRDEEGTFVLAKTKLIPVRQDVEIGEAMSFLEALSWVVDLGFDKVIIEGDAKVVVDAIGAPARSESVFGDYIQACKSIIRSNPEFSINFVRRDVNLMAHEFARVSREFGNSFCWLDPPAFVDELTDKPCVCNNVN